MPRKVYALRWIAKVAAAPERVAAYNKRVMTSDCVIQSPDNLADTPSLDPIIAQMGDLGPANFVPSPMPGVNNLMYEEKLTWVAVMEDGTRFEQYQEKEMSSEDIPRDKLRKFCLVDDENTVVFLKELQPGWRFFYRRRTALPTVGQVHVVHVVGWRIPVGDQWVTQVAFVYEADGTICISDMVMGKPEPVLGKLFLWRHPINSVAADDIIIT